MTTSHAELKTCDTCGNEYDKTFTVHWGEQVGTFDSFECAAHLMAPALSLIHI